MDALLFYALVFVLLGSLIAWLADQVKPEPEPEPAPCPVCNDRCDWGGWDIPEWADPVYCKGCGGLIGVDA